MRRRLQLQLRQPVPVEEEGKCALSSEKTNGGNLQTSENLDRRTCPPASPATKTTSSARCVLNPVLVSGFTTSTSPTRLETSGRRSQRTLMPRITASTPATSPGIKTHCAPIRATSSMLDRTSVAPLISSSDFKQRRGSSPGTSNLSEVAVSPPMATRPVLSPREYVFNKATVSGSGSGTAYLGRPWRPYAHVVFQNSNLGKVINSAGWEKWDSSTSTANVYFKEYNNSGTGASTSKRVSFSGQLKTPVTITDILGSSYKSQWYVDADFL